MKTAKQRKVLILGGITHMIDVVKTAKKMGMYAIVTDNNVGSPAKEFADKAYDISTSDTEKLAKIANDEEIDGVFTAFDDINTWNALKLCKKLNLPFYASNEQLAITSNKDKFKEFCRTFNVPVIEEYSSEENIWKNIEFPVIVKPVDSYASQGISVCYDQHELEDAYLKAEHRSKSGKVIVERFIDSTHGVEMYYTVQDGHVILTAVTDRYVYKATKEHPPLPIATLFPSKHMERYIETVDQRIRKMIEGLKIDNGLVFIQSLYDDGDFYIYEMGFRLSGEQHYQVIEKQTGVSLLEMMLDLSVGKETDNYSLKEYDGGFMPFPSCNLSILLGAGTIAEIRGIDEILELPEVISFVSSRHVGDGIEMTGSYAQMFGRFNIVAQTTEDLDRVINKINKTLQVISSDNREMILARYEPYIAEMGTA
jgi:biotin carboxylase